MVVDVSATGDWEAAELKVEAATDGELTEALRFDRVGSAAGTGAAVAVAASSAAGCVGEC